MLVSATPQWPLSGLGAEVGVTGGAVLEASHSAPECGCFWVSRSGRAAGLEAAGAGDPWSLGLQTKGTGCCRSGSSLSLPTKLPQILLSEEKQMKVS